MTKIYFGTLQQISELKVNKIYEISEDENSKIEDATSTIYNFVQDSYLYTLVTWNFEEFIGLVRQYLEAFATKDSRFLTKRPIEININRCFLNFLSATRSYLWFMETLLKRRLKDKSDLSDAFKNYCKNEYDNSFSYRFMYKLRDYAQHCGFPINQIGFEKGFTNIEKGEITTHVKLLANRDIILQDFDWKSFKNELIEQPNEIDIFPHSLAFMNSLKIIHYRIMKDIFSTLKDSAQTILKYSPNSKLAQQGIPIVYTIDNSEGEGKIINQRELPIDLATFISNDDFDSIFKPSTGL